MPIVHKQKSSITCWRICIKFGFLLHLSGTWWKSTSNALTAPWHFGPTFSGQAVVAGVEPPQPMCSEVHYQDLQKNAPDKLAPAKFNLLALQKRFAITSGRSFGCYNPITSPAVFTVHCWLVDKSVLKTRSVYIRSSTNFPANTRHWLNAGLMLAR